MKKRELTAAEKAIVAVVGTVAVICTIALQFVGGGTQTGTGAAAQAETSETKTQKETQAETQKETIIDNDLVTADYEGAYEAPGVQDMFYLTLNVQNKRSKSIWVYLDKASVNNETVSMVITGVPLYIEPGNSGRTGFGFPMGQLSIHSLSEVKNVKFDLVVADEATLTEIWRAEGIEIS